LKQASKQTRLNNSKIEELSSCYIERGGREREVKREKVKDGWDVEEISKVWGLWAQLIQTEDEL
jgi:hypothetical protein